MYRIAVKKDSQVYFFDSGEVELRHEDINKARIRSLSGLPFNKQVNGKRVSAVPLLALNKDESLKEYQEKRLNHDIRKDAFGRDIPRIKIPDELDLFDKPSEGIYII